MKQIVTLFIALAICPVFLFAQTIDLSWSDAAVQITQADLPGDAKFVGRFYSGVTWEDKMGTNHLFFSEVWNRKETRNDLYMYQYITRADITKKIWEEKEYSPRGCRLVVIPHSIHVIDLDGDGIMECGFMYQEPCKREEAIRTKLLMFSKGKKMAMRGEIPRFKGFGKQTKQLDASMKSSSKLVQRFANIVWDDFVTDNRIDYARNWEFFNKDMLILSVQDKASTKGTYFQWITGEGKYAPLSDEAFRLVKYARELILLDDGEHLLVCHDDAIGTIHIRTYEFKKWVGFFEYTHLLTNLLWSPDGSKITFTTFNTYKYPLETKIFVLTLDGNNLVKKEKYDVEVDYEIKDHYLGSPLEWQGNDRIMYVPRRSMGVERQVDRERLDLDNS